MTEPEPNTGGLPVAPPTRDERTLDQLVEDESERTRFIAFEPRWLRRSVIAILFIALAFTVGTWLFERTADFLFWLLLAWLVAIAMEPMVAYLSRKGMRRGLASGLVLLGFLLLFLVFLVAFGGLLGTQLVELVQNVPDLVTEVVDWINRTFNQNINPNDILDQLNLDSTQIANIAQNLGFGILGVLTSIVGFIFAAFTITVFAFYFSADGPRLRRTIGSWLPQRRQKVFVTVWEIAVAKTGGFVISRAVLAIASSFFHVVFFKIIDIPYWLPLGIFAGITSQFIPTIGTYIGIAFPVLFAVFEDPWDAVWIIAFATVYQQVENYVFTPRISRATMDVHPAIAIGSVIVGAAIFGPIGALIGIPIAAGVIAVIETYGQRYDLLPELAEREAGEKKEKEKRSKKPHDDEPATGTTPARATTDGQ